MQKGYYCMVTSQEGASTKIQEFLGVWRLTGLHFEDSNSTFFKNFSFIIFISSKSCKLILQIFFVLICNIEGVGTGKSLQLIALGINFAKIATLFYNWHAKIVMKHAKITPKC